MGMVLALTRKRFGGGDGEMTGDTQSSPVILAAGGTGGHMFPAEALARELLARGQRVVLVTDRRGTAFGDALPEVEVHRIRASQLRQRHHGQDRAACVELTHRRVPGPPR